MQLFSKYAKWIYRGFFLSVFAYVNTGHLKVKKEDVSTIFALLILWNSDAFSR